MQLATWQSERLQQTYADLLASQRYEVPARYFLSDLYGPKDYTQRDQQVERVYNKARKLLPEHMVKPLADALAMNVLSQALDIRLCIELFDTMGIDRIDVDSYVAAYRRCDNYALRCRQIGLIRSIGHELDSVVRKPLLGMLLRMSRGPAHLAGLGELQQALERGFDAFKGMRGADEFVAIIVEREQRILQRIYAGDPQPFAPEEDRTVS
ncbi:MAG: hypothetical protein U1F63_05160 [Chitinivorax sp.]